MPKKVKKIIKKPKKKFFLTLYLVAILVALSWVVVGTYYEKRPTEIGQLLQNKQIDNKGVYNNLDLRQASLATYDNQAIIRARDLGVSHGVDHRIFSFKVPKDNLTEYGMMSLPTTPQPAKGYPVIILCHGYYNPWVYPTEQSYLPDMNFYSQHGFVVIKPDFRGQGLSTASGSPEGAYYSMAYNTDIMSLIAAIKQTNYLDKKQISLWGHSMGGYIALRAAVVSPDVKNVILLAAPVGYIQDMFTAYVAISDTANPVAARIRGEQLDQHGTPLTNPGFWNYVSPLNYLDKTRAYVQIHVGIHDNVVPAQFSEDLDTALSHAGKPHEYYVYKDGGHGLVPQRAAVWSRSLDLLTKPSASKTAI